MLFTNLKPLRHAIDFGLDLLIGHFGGNINAFNLTTGHVLGGSIIPGTWAGTAIDSVNDHIYVTRTDYQTYGWLYRYDYTGSLLDSLEVGPSPEALAVDYDVLAAQPEPQEALALQVFPQPASDRVTLDLRAMKPETVAVQISDLSGRSVRAYELRGGKMETLDLSDLAPGAYAIVAKTRSDIRTGKLIKAAR